MGSSPTRMLRNFNIEERAMKVISKDKPAMAPRYPVKEDQAYTGRGQRHEQGKQSKGTLRSNKSNTHVQISNEDGFSALLLNQQCRMSKNNFNIEELSSLNVLTVPSGRLSIVEVVTLLGKAKRDPSTWTPQHAAEEYSFSEEQARMLMENFSIFEVVFTADVKERLTEEKQPEMINTPS
uniref:NADH dehydrogenase [ubiquinone] 1 alpha subcomplex assembly factor 4 n=1 Tax=Eptatretus burgeri TaxID=7764 RepID=A0A8C4N2J4_EPTBU